MRGVGVYGVVAFEEDDDDDEGEGRGMSVW